MRSIPMIFALLKYETFYTESFEFVSGSLGL